MTEALKKMIYNIPEDMVVEINQVRDVIAKIVGTHETNLESYETVVGKIKEQKYFLETAKRRFPTAKERDKYEEVRTRLLNEVDTELRNFEGRAKEERNLLTLANGYLEYFDNHVSIEKDDNDDVHFDYDKEFYTAVLGLAKAISLDGLF